MKGKKDDRVVPHSQSANVPPQFANLLPSKGSSGDGSNNIKHYNK